MAGGKSDYLELKELDGVLGGTNFTQPATVYLALFTDTNTQAQRDAGTATEPSGNAYARLAITNNSTNWPAASGVTATKSNGVALTMATPTPLGWGLVVAFGIYDAVTTGNQLYWGDLLATEHPATISLANPGVATSPAHGFVQHDKVKFSSLPGVSVPTGMTDGAYYFVLSGTTTDTFTFSATDGGSGINCTASGGGKFGKTQEVTVNANVAPSFAISALVITED